MGKERRTANYTWWIWITNSEGICLGRNEVQPLHWKGDRRRKEKTRGVKSLCFFRWWGRRRLMCVNHADRSVACSCLSKRLSPSSHSLFYVCVCVVSVSYLSSRLSFWLPLSALFSVPSISASLKLFFFNISHLSCIPLQIYRIHILYVYMVCTRTGAHTLSPSLSWSVSEPLTSLVRVTHHNKIQQTWSSCCRTFLPCCLNWKLSTLQHNTWETLITN